MQPPTSTLFVTLGLLAIVAYGALPGGAQAPPPVPCGDPRGCPDLVVDGTRLVAGTQRTESFPANSCSVIEGQIVAGNRQVLRFTFNTPNIGDGDLIVGDPSDHPEWFEWSPCHAHYHFKEYADYRLWTVAGYQEWDALRNANPDKKASEVLAENPQLADDLVEGRKQGFCVIDIAPGVPTPEGVAILPDPVPKYLSCADQGISKGWADEYLFTLTGQWIDVTNVPTGAYMLEAEVNAEWLYVELSYANNRAALPVAVASPL